MLAAEDTPLGSSAAQALRDYARVSHAQAAYATQEILCARLRLDPETRRSILSLLNDTLKNDLVRAPPGSSIKERFQREGLILSELPHFLEGRFKLEVPVYTVWGACEDVSVLEKLRSGEYKIPNLHIIDEAHSRLLEVGGVKLRLLGLGGAVVMHKLFDNGEGKTTIAGGQGTMWTTLLQMGELVDTANRVYDPTETRVFVTHASPAREGILNQLSVTLKADFSVSAGLHFRYGSSYNEFSVNPTLDHYRGKLAASKASFNDVWETVKHEVEPAVAENEQQQRLLSFALDVVSKMPTVANGGNPFGGGQGGPASGQVDESAFKNMWNFNLADAAFGWLVLDIDQGRIGTEMRAQGFNFSHRGGKAQRSQAAPVAPATAGAPPTGGNLPTPSAQPTPAPAPAPVPAPAAQPPAQQPAPQAQQARAPPAAPAPAQSPQPPKPAQQAPAQSIPSPAPPKAPTPAAATNGTATASTDRAAPSEAKPNGTAQATAQSEATTPKPEYQPAKPSQAIYVPNVQGVDNEDEVRAIFTEDDAKKIIRIEKTAKGFFIAHFGSPEEMQDVLKRAPNKEGKYSSIRVSEFKTGGTRGGRGGYAGTWGSSRGGAQGASQGQGGYRSGGASDSEGGRGGRGRGGFRGGRGGDRGGRGRGRGGPGKDGSAAPAAGGDA
ncbi:hypothetical protein H2203_008177 [Taxawa tesnikishii (nom. ined.)]|nr:hypothetical protein H2203_008177 [Dothideales sp. JES 119]